MKSNSGWITGLAVRVILLVGILVGLWVVGLSQQRAARVASAQGGATATPTVSLTPTPQETPNLVVRIVGGGIVRVEPLGNCVLRMRQNASSYSFRCDPFTPTPTRTNTPSPTRTSTPSPTPTHTPTFTNTPSPTRTNTPTLTNTPSPTATHTPTLTNTPSPTPTDTPTLTNTPSPTPTDTPSPTFTPTQTDTVTPSATFTPLPTITPPLPPMSATPTVTPSPTFTPLPTVSPASILWGAYIDGSTYGSPVDAPHSWSVVDLFQSHAKKNISILYYGKAWIRFGVYQRFWSGDLEKIRSRGVIPLISWSSCEAGVNPDAQPHLTLRSIYEGKHDNYIRQFAADAKAWGHPFFLRHNTEANGGWYCYSERRNGNQPGDFVKAWRHVHDIFREVGVTNATWVWAMNIEGWCACIPLEQLYPGDAYTDWVGADGYNFAPNSNCLHRDVWRSFESLHRGTYNKIQTFAPNKPYMFAETGSSEQGGDKAAWIRDMFRVIPTYPNVRAVLWFNWGIPSGDCDWPIETSQAAQDAFAAGIANPIFATNTFANTGGGKVPLLKPLSR